jgi:hypothetical protein
MIVIIEKIISIKHKQKACTSMIVIIEKIISIKHKNNKINIRTIRKGTKYYSIYKTLPFAHIGMTDFPSRSPKYIC